MMLLKAVSAAKTPGIVTSNLSLYLSAHNPNSYGGSGTTVYDISVNDNHATLTNGPTYSTDNGGYFSTDGVNDYIVDNSTSGSPWGFGTGAFTVELWVQYKNNTIYHNCTDSRRRTSVYANNFGFHDYRDINNYKLNLYYNTGVIFTSTNGLTVDTWYHLVFSRSSTGTNDMKFYVNNTVDKTTTLSQSFTDYNYYQLASSVDSGRAAIWLAQIRVYKGKALTDAEVEQNFNAHRRLYGL